MKIGIDASITRYANTGTSVYTANLIKSLIDEFGDEQFRLLYAYSRPKFSDKKNLSSRFQTLYRDIFWQQMILPIKSNLANFSCLHLPYNLSPIFAPCPTVITIHDTILMSSAHKPPKWQGFYFRHLSPLAVRKARMIITDSEYSKKDILKYFKISSGKIAVTNLAANPYFKLLKNSDVKAVKEKYHFRKFIFVVGNLEPRKNMDRIIEAFARIGKLSDEYQLVHVGPRGWQFESALRKIEELGLKDKVIFLGQKPNIDLVELYNAASLFLFPSLYEGFGIPIIEAMSCGCPVLTSNVTSIPEVAGDAAVMVDPYDVEAIAEGMKAILTDSNFADSLREKGFTQAARFSWQRCARETYQVYQQVAKSS